MVGHRMGVAMGKDHQVSFTEQHRPVKPFYGEPARSFGDDMEAGNLSGGYTKAPGRPHFSAAIQDTFQMDRLEQTVKGIFLKSSQGLHRNSSLLWTIGKES